MIRFKYGLNAKIAPSPPSSSRPPSGSPAASPPPPPSGSVEGGAVVYRYESLSDLPERYHPKILEDDEIEAILVCFPFLFSLFLLSFSCFLSFSDFFSF